MRLPTLHSQQHYVPSIFSVCVINGAMGNTCRIFSNISIIPFLAAIRIGDVETEKRTRQLFCYKEQGLTFSICLCILPRCLLETTLTESEVTLTTLGTL